MQKTILITGSTDGIGTLTAKTLIQEGHNVIIHGRNQEKIDAVKNELEKELDGNFIDSFKADLSNIKDVKKLANDIKEKYSSIDVLINNAGIYKTPEALSVDGLDVRFAVNTIAPYLLTIELLAILAKDSRVVNLSSAAQAPVSLNALLGKPSLGDGEAYAQSKLAITMWTKHLANKYPDGPLFIAVNPKSFLGSKMVKEAYGMAGNDLSFGSDILTRAALSQEFEGKSGAYYDNDIAQFALPHPQALDTQMCATLVEAIESYLNEI
jgi:NAD(P)-dependent dehydrogenase (short-subunit alcohol dehydrogenase family)